MSTVTQGKPSRNTKIQNVPRELRDAHCWGAWSFVGSDKVPLYKVNEPKKWKRLVEVTDVHHLAFVFDATMPWFSVDLDWKRTGAPTPEQQRIIAQAIKLGLYMEKSPSKLGVHLWGRADKTKWPRSPSGKLSALKRDELGIEMYASDRYFTVTGDSDKPFDNGLPDATQFALELFTKHKKKRDALPVQRDAPTLELVQQALVHLDPDCGYDEWLHVGQALHDWDDAFNLWDEWSAKSAKKYPGRDALVDKWASFTAGSGITIATLFDHARERGFDFKPDAAEEFSQVPQVVQEKFVRELVLLDASKIKPKKIDWVWQDYLALGTFHMIVGVQGDGKTVFTYGMIAALTGGRPFINGDKPTQTGRVLLIQGEEDPSTVIVPRLQAAGAMLKRVSIVSHAREHESKEEVHRAFSLQDDVNSTRIKLEEAEMLGDAIIAIVIDPITAYMAGKKKIDAFRDDEMRSMLMPWVRLINKHHVILIVVAHLNKTSGQRAVHRVAQSAAATAAARAVYLVSPANGVADFIEDPDLKIFVPAKYNLGKHPPAQLFGVDGYEHPQTGQSVGYVVSKGTSQVHADDVLSSKKSAERATPLRDKIWDCVSVGAGGLTRKQITEAVVSDFENHGFREAIQAMLNNGMLIDRRRKLYTPKQTDMSNSDGQDLIL